MRDERLAFKIEPAMRTAMTVARGCHVNGIRRGAAEGNQIIAARFFNGGSRPAISSTAAIATCVQRASNQIIRRIVVVRLSATSPHRACYGPGDDLTGCRLSSSDALATALRARSNCAGNFLSRFVARRRIPAQAFGLKKYRCGIAPVARMADKEQTVAPLRQSKKLRVQACPCAKIPEFIH